MRVHRFYTGPDLQLKKDFWLHDEALLWQWNKVLRFRDGQEVILFDGLQTDRLYRITKLAKTEAHLGLVSELERMLPRRHIYLFWSLLKRDNNEYILQKCTELGVSNFIPLITERTVKKDYNLDRARKIAHEASEQCGRSNIPIVREPIHLKKAVEEYQDHLQFIVCHKGHVRTDEFEDSAKYGLLIGPEGGWSSNELDYFEQKKFSSLDLSDFTLRAETAAVAATAKIL